MWLVLVLFNSTRGEIEGFVGDWSWPLSCVEGCGGASGMGERCSTLYGWAHGVTTSVEYVILEPISDLAQDGG